MPGAGSPSTGQREHSKRENSSPEILPDSPIASRTRRQQSLAPLREAVGPDATRIFIKVPFSSFDLETWTKVAKEYRSDPWE